MSLNKTLQPLEDDKLRAAFGAMSHPRDFRPFVAEKIVPELNVPRTKRTRQVMEQPFFREQRAIFDQLMAEPYRGITTDGTLRPVGRKPVANGAPKAAMEAAAEALVAVLRPEIAEKVRFETGDQTAWRRWHNMPMMWPIDGVGLEEMTEEEHKATHALLAASLSKEGYSHLCELMAINRFSGDLLKREKYLNENCFNIGLFGEPGSGDWGWQLYGHHVCLNLRLVGDAYVLSPFLLAAEPTLIDEGPNAGVNAFLSNEEAGLALIRGLAPAVREAAVILPSILAGDVPEGRRNWADSLHLGGAFRDNRVIPLEGVCAREFTEADRRRLLAAVETFHMILPDGPRAARMAEIEAHLDQTWLTWMGGYGDWDPFYYRIQSPVVIVEFDHHQAVFLTNAEPARFHVHTLARIPEGGDYGMDLIKAAEGQS